MDPLSLLLDKKKTEQKQAAASATQPRAAASADAGLLGDVSAALGARERPSLEAAGLGTAQTPPPGRGADAGPGLPAAAPAGGGYPTPAPAVAAAAAAAPPAMDVAAFLGTAVPPLAPAPGLAAAAGQVPPGAGGGPAKPVTFEDMLPGEKVHVVLGSCFLLVRNPLSEVLGRLLITNYRLKFQSPKGSLRDELRWLLDAKYFDVPMGAVEDVKEERGTTATGALELKVTVHTKDFRSLVLLLRSEEDCRTIAEAVTAFSAPGNSTLLFAFRHAEEARASANAGGPDGWTIYDPEQEYTRMGVETGLVPSPGSPWLVSRVNAHYGLCSSYPALLALPRRMTEHELRAVAGFRKKGRLPAMSWCGGPELNYASLWRCSQTTEGLMGQKCMEDQKMVEFIRRGSDPQADRDLLLIDLRPWKSAWANKAGGGGFEGYPRCRFVFGNIDNIHCVREAWRAMGKAVSNVVEGEPGTWMKDVANSCWYDYMGAILQSAQMVVTEILQFKSSAMVHCSDGWDRTAQVASLAMMCLDHHYRTQEGLLRLIQKEWCSFGHRFRTRLALGEAPSNEYSPVFIQWLDCVFQLFQQFPTAFEWTPAVLLRLAQEAVTNCYGTFLCDSEQERSEKVKPYTLSLWSALLRPEEASTWFNWDYQPTPKALIPNICQANYAVWDAYWFRFHVRGQLQQRSSTEAARPAASLPTLASASLAAPLRAADAQPRSPSSAPPSAAATGAPPTAAAAAAPAAGAPLAGAVLAATAPTAPAPADAAQAAEAPSLFSREEIMAAAAAAAAPGGAAPSAAATAAAAVPPAPAAVVPVTEAGQEARDAVAAGGAPSLFSTDELAAPGAAAAGAAARDADALLQPAPRVRGLFGDDA